MLALDQGVNINAARQRLHDTSPQKLPPFQKTRSASQHHLGWDVPVKVKTTPPVAPLARIPRQSSAADKPLHIPTQDSAIAGKANWLRSAIGCSITVMFNVLPTDWTREEDETPEIKSNQIIFFICISLMYLYFICIAFSCSWHSEMLLGSCSALNSSNQQQSANQ